MNSSIRRSPRPSGDDIGLFLAVCHRGSFAGAAAQLALTPSAVAKAIGRLEARLRTRLFHRTTRRLTLTAEAILYRQACEAARDQMNRVEAELAALAVEPAGLVRLSLPPLLGNEVIAPALYALGRQWPHLRFDISTSTQPADLPGEAVDIAVRIGELPDLPGLTLRRLGVQRIVLCGARSYFMDRPMPQDVEQLSRHALIASMREGRVAPWHFLSCDGDRQSVTPHARLILDGSMLALSAVRSGEGLALLPRWLVTDAIAAGDLVPVLDDRIEGHMPVHALWSATPSLPPRLRVTIDAIVKATRALFG